MYLDEQCIIFLDVKNQIIYINMIIYVHIYICNVM